MQLKIERWWSRKDATVGSLYVDGTWECYTREEPARKDGLFIAGESALPVGLYNVSIAASRRFGRDVPLLVGTRCPIGMQLHPGHPVRDTDDCVLLGQAQLAHKLERTKLAFEALFAKLLAAIAAGEAIDLEIAQGVRP